MILFIAVVYVKYSKHDFILIMCIFIDLSICFILSS